MTWEETICMIRKMPEFSELIKDSYLEEDVVSNQVRFRAGKEYGETLRIIRQYTSGKQLDLLDIGAGNGISSVSFALDGFHVTSVEPDESETVGVGAIERLKKNYGLDSLRIIQCHAEKLPLADASFDIVYARQAMHHAADLSEFVSEISRVLKHGGIYFSVRDHVIYNKKDKENFLQQHPLQSFYHGENAYTLKQYRRAIKEAGLDLELELSHYESAINYYPSAEKSVEEAEQKRQQMITNLIEKKLNNKFANNNMLRQLIAVWITLKLGPVLDEKRVTGRLYSFISIKK